MFLCPVRFFPSFFIPFCYDIFSLLHCKTIVFYLLKSLCTLFHPCFAGEKIAICILSYAACAFLSTGKLAWVFHETCP